MKLIPITLLILMTGILSAGQKTNILFIAIDDLKPTLGCYGDPIAKTPSIDKLAERGTVFMNAQCQWPVCGPSRASLMTSLYPEAVGVMDLKTDMRKKNPDVLTLPQHFHNHGYTTVGTGKIYDPRCVDAKRTLDNPSWSLPYHHQDLKKVKFNKVHKVVMAPELDDSELMDGQIALSGVKLMRELAADTRQPFFLAVGFKKPHLPFIAPKTYWDLYRRDSLPLAKHRGGIENDSGYVIHDSPEFRGYDGAPESGPISEDLQREAMHGYYACTSFIDAQIGILIKELETLNLTENTAIVLWGDHGFHLGDHSMWGKHSALDQAARVPLIMISPGGSKIKRTNAPVELSDIFPTLCDWAGIPVPENIAGRSFEPLIKGEIDSIREGAITVFNKKGAIGYSYRTRRYRYNEWVNKFGKTVATDLFDYETDPHETKNIAGDPQHIGVVTKLAKSLRRDARGCDRLDGKKDQ